MLIYDVLHKEKVYHVVASDLRGLGVKYRFKKSMLKSERLEIGKDIPKRIFKTPLFYQALDIVNLMSGGIVHVPAFVIQAATFLEECITQEGLFRKAGSQARQRELISRLDNGGNLGDRCHAVDVANCLKSFFRDLPEPLIPYAYHDLFVHCALLKSCRVQALLLACVLLPPHHLNTLAFFMEFLKKVSMYEKQNKMSVENLAKVIGPNIMPVRDTTIAAAQNRLQMHLSIIKILIENSQDIGVLPPHVIQNISSEISSSMDNGLDSSELFRKSKKKKHRSGSLTRMFNGLRKMVGKSADDTSNHSQPPVCSTQLNTSSNKFTKKRKVAEKVDTSNIIKKKKIIDKLDKSKKVRLSLDKLVPKNKSKNVDGELSDSCTNKQNTDLRRWSSQEYDNIFFDADVNLSDDEPSEQGLHVNKDHRRISEQWRIDANESSRKLDATDESDSTCLLMPEEKTDSEGFDTSIPNTDTISSLSDRCEEDYVRISKSEYEDIKNRVSAIESRISQEFGSIYNEENNISTHLVNKVQTAYEKTLEEANIENTLTSDYLAKKLSKELKIRKSGEHKIIRSPSARKIGSLRRRSQEKVTSKRVRRTASWHISPEFNSQHYIQLEKQTNIYNNAKDEIACLRNQVNTLISRSTEHCQISNNNLDLSDFKDLYFTNNRTSSCVRRASSFHGKDFVDNSSYFDKKIDDLKKTNSHQNIVSNKDYLQRENIESSNEMSWKDAERYFKSASRVNTPAPQTGRASVAKLRAQNAGMVLAKAKLFDECTMKTSAIVSARGTSRKHCRDNTNKRSPKTAKEVNVNTEHFKREHSYKRTQVSRKQSTKEKLKNKNCNAIALSPNTLPQTKRQVTVISLKPLQEHMDKNYHFAQELELQNKKLLHKDPIIHQISINDKAINVIRDMQTHQKENTNTKVSPLKKISIDTASQNSNTCNSYKLDVNKTPHIKRPLTLKTPNSKSLVRRPPVETRRTPLRATAQLGTPRRQSPRSILKTRTLSMHTEQMRKA